MKKKKQVYEGSIHHLPFKKIYLNIEHLKEGRYEMQIIHNRKVIKTIRFEK
ncbi:MAG: hypothetical protein AAF363_02915 [Bacteroidota bacterium]